MDTDTTILTERLDNAKRWAAAIEAAYDRYIDQRPTFTFTDWSIAKYEAYRTACQRHEARYGLYNRKLWRALRTVHRLELELAQRGAR